MQTEDSRAIVASITRWFESLTPGNLGQLEAFYSADAQRRLLTSLGDG